MVSHSSESPVCLVPALPLTSIIQISRSPVPSSAGCIKTHLNRPDTTTATTKQQQRTPEKRLHALRFWRGVKSRSPDPGCDSVWKLPPLLLGKKDQAGKKERERKWSEERRETEGGGGAPRWGWSDDLMLPLVSAEHQLTWFPGCYKGRKKQSNLQLYNRRYNDTLNDNDIYWHYVKWKVFIWLRSCGERGVRRAFKGFKLLFY